ncbi:MAG: ATPase [Deltaproteobacteria bacterium GWA2_55_10]|nr:MAG: ATPase [Deltaproteobacteria bacterium GWA2_55_10]
MVMAGEYEKFFNLKAKPFELVPNPEFLYLSKTHRKAMTYLEYGITERAGFILLTGEVGSGKTTLIRDLIRKLDSTVVLSKVFNTRVNSDQLIAMINDDFGLPVAGKDKTALIKDLYDFLIEMYAKGRHPVLVIDEAQNLDRELLEEVRMLSNLETDSSKLLQIILVGQPELKRMLAQPELRQFRQRINISCHLYNLMKEEVEGYIRHRLEIAGNRDAVKFESGAIDIIHRHSRGVPRLINIICDFILLTAFFEKTRTITGDAASEVIGELDFENRYWDTHSEERGKDAEPAAGAGDLEELRKCIKDLAARLDSIEKRPPVADLSAHREIVRRLTILERVLQGHFEQNHSVKEKTDDRPEPYDIPVKYSSKVERSSPPRRNIFRRIFS